jgi:hypothetical protein
MRTLLAMLLLSVGIFAQQQTPDLSRYGSLSRQMVVQRNLDLQKQEMELRQLRRRQEEIRRNERYIVVSGRGSTLLETDRGTYQCRRTYYGRPRVTGTYWPRPSRVPPRHYCSTR